MSKTVRALAQSVLAITVLAEEKIIQVGDAFITFSKKLLAYFLG